MYGNTTGCYDALAQVAIKRKDYEHAEKMLNKSLEIHKIALGENHLYYQKTYRNLQREYFDCNSNGNFEQWLEEQMKER